MKPIKLIITTALIVLLTACGGGDGDVKTGQFKDSAVKGLNYETVSQSGITDKDGTFYYRAGETVSFYLGEMYLGKAEGADILYPTDIATEENATTIAQILQTLDKNQYQNDGIDVVGQFNPANTKNQNLQIYPHMANAQDLIDDISLTPKTIVPAQTAQAYMETTIANDKLNANTQTQTFSIESISKPIAAGQIQITEASADNPNIKTGLLAFTPNFGESIWLLAKKPSEEIKSISAEIHYISSVFLILELSNQGVSDYFVIGINNSCSLNCFLDVAPTFVLDFGYKGRITTCQIPEMSYDYLLPDLDNSIIWTPDVSKPLILGSEQALNQIFQQTAAPNQRIAIEFDRANKRIILKYGDKSGYFDINNAHFGNLNTATAKFFINANLHSSSNTGIELQPEAFIDNVQVNAQAFDDFSASTLDPQRWDQGKFLNSFVPNFGVNAAFNPPTCLSQ